MVTTFYNRACPVCRMEIDHYERTCHASGIPSQFVDIQQEPDALADHGLAADDVKRRLYCIDEDGHLHGGIDAAAVMWRAIPSYHWLARRIQLPGVNRTVHWVYDRVLAPTLYAWNERRTRREMIRR